MSTPARHPVHALADEFVAAFAVLSPVTGTMAGVRGIHDGWDDFSPEGAASLLAMLRAERERFSAVAAGDDRWAGVARRVAIEFLDDRIAYFEAEDHLSDLNNIESPFQHVKMV